MLDILLVDDPDLRDVLEEQLTEAGHRVQTAADGRTGAEHIKKRLFDLVICDEINNAVHNKLITKADLKKLIKTKSPKTSLCLTGRDFPPEFLAYADIATNMTKIRHHFDDKFLANKGIDF